VRRKQQRHVIVAGCIRHAEAQGDTIEESRFADGGTRGAQIVAGMEHEFVDARLEAGSFEKRRIEPAVVIGDGACDLSALLAVQPVEIDREPPGRLAERGIELLSPRAGLPSAVSSTWVVRRPPAVIVRSPRVAL
jgi:hypothetical protein